MDVVVSVYRDERMLRPVTDIHEAEAIVTTLVGAQPDRLSRVGGPATSDYLAVWPDRTLDDHHSWTEYGILDLSASWVGRVTGCPPPPDVDPLGDTP